MDPPKTPLESSLPEAVPIDRGTPKYYNGPADDSPKEVYEPLNSTTAYSQPAHRSRFLRWPCLFFFALLIAVISGLIGGFIGKAITENKQPSTTSSPLPSASASGQQPSAPTTCTNSTGETQNRTTYIALPETGCPDESGRTIQSEFTRMSYRKYCNVDWPGSDMVAFLAPTMSDCIEACGTWNDNRARGTELCVPNTGGDDLQGDELNAKECVGASFMPQWAVNRTASVEALGKAGNCFLKNQVVGYPPSDREKDGILVVGLCLEDKCP